MGPLDLISLVQAKEYLKVDFADEDVFITSLIKSAIEQIELRTEQRLYDRAEILYPTGDDFTTAIFPIISVTSITEDGTPLVLDTDYTVHTKTYGKTFCFNDCEDRIITLSVGYTTGNCPESLRGACFNLIEYWFNNRGASDIPSNVEERISTFRRSPW